LASSSSCSTSHICLFTVKGHKYHLLQDRVDHQYTGAPEESAVPVLDEDLGLPENVEDIVTAMIKHNS
jgi:hypothetical protein